MPKMKQGELLRELFKNDSNEYIGYPNILFDYVMGTISPVAYALLMQIARRSIAIQTESCSVSVAEFTRSFKASKSTILKAKKELEKKGLIRVERTLTTNGKPDANIYTINIDALIEAEEIMENNGK